MWRVHRCRILSDPQNIKNIQEKFYNREICYNFFCFSIFVHKNFTAVRSAPETHESGVFTTRWGPWGYPAPSDPSIKNEMWHEWPHDTFISASTRTDKFLAKAANKSTFSGGISDTSLDPRLDTKDPGFVRIRGRSNRSKMFMKKYWKTKKL